MRLGALGFCISLVWLARDIAYSRASKRYAKAIARSQCENKFLSACVSAAEVWPFRAALLMWLGLNNATQGSLSVAPYSIVVVRTEPLIKLINKTASWSTHKNTEAPFLTRGSRFLRRPHWETFHTGQDMRPTKTARFFAAKFFKAGRSTSVAQRQLYVSWFWPKREKIVFWSATGIKSSTLSRCLYSGIFILPCDAGISCRAELIH
jgi:hypothetical protein